VRPLKIGSLFSGIGGLELGLEWAGLGHTLWQVEQDEYCRAVLAKHWPDAKRYDDVKTFNARSIEHAALSWVDLICGGFPCQDVSGAGKGAGLSGDRSGLWYEFARIAAECRPDWLVIENVASGAKKWVDAVRGDLERIGYASLPVPLAARDVGAPHRRLRIFLVAHAMQPRLEGAEPEPSQGGGSADPGAELHGRGAGSRSLEPQASGVSDCDGVAVRDDEQRMSSRRPDGVRDQGDAIPRYSGQDVADCGGDGSGVLGPRDDARGSIEHDEARDFAHRRDEGMAHVFPPFRDDLDGWGRYLASGGPQPGILPGPDGLPRGVARRRIASLGNAVVPQDAEVVGWIIRKLIEEKESGR